MKKINNQKYYDKNKRKEKYSNYYTKFFKKNNSVFPSEFLVKLFLGKSKKILSLTKYKSKKILDLSFGDGRNLIFFKNLKFNTYGTEISKDIINRFKKKKKNINLKIGTSTNLPFKNNFFNIVVAYNSFYYLEEKEEISDAVKEISRILKKNGLFIGTIPTKNNYLFKNSLKLGKYKYYIKKDPLKLRNNSIVACVRSKKDANNILKTKFNKINFGHIFINNFGLNENVITFVAKKC